MSNTNLGEERVRASEPAPRTPSAVAWGRRLWLGWAMLIVAGVTAALFSAAVDDVVMFDDFTIGEILRAWIDGRPGGSWWDVFRLLSFDEARRFGGSLPWWTSEDVGIRFFRPVASATHAVDYLLWPASPVTMKVHSVVWAMLLGVAVTWLMWEALGPKTALLVAIIYVVSYLHFWPVAWISNRNALLAATFGMFSLACYRRRRLAGRWPGWVVPLLLAASLLSAEVGISTLAYIVSFELFEGKRQPRRRWAALLVVALVVVGWRMAYDFGGFGAFDSGAYIDPLRAAGLFVHKAPARLWGLLAHLLSSPEVAVVAPGTHAQSVLQGVFLVGSCVSVVCGVLDARGRSWLAGAALALIPLLASVPHARLLTFVWVGMSVCTALALSRLIVWGWGGRVACLIVGLGPLLCSPALVLGIRAGGAGTVNSDSMVAQGLEKKTLRGRNLVLIHAPSYLSALTLGAELTAAKSRPAFVWVLSVGDEAPQLERRGCCSIVLRAEGGLVQEEVATYYRGPQVPYTVGQRVQTLGFLAVVEAVNEWGAASRVVFEFPHDLEVRQVVFVTWSEAGYRRVKLPPLRELGR